MYRAQTFPEPLSKVLIVKLIVAESTEGRRVGVRAPTVPAYGMASSAQLNEDGFCMPLIIVQCKDGCAVKQHKDKSKTELMHA